MKKIFILFFTLLALSAAHAQCPQYVAFDTTICHSTVSRTIDVRGLATRLCGDSVTVTFNDSLTALNGSRQVYFHAGPEFRPFTGWQAAYTADSAMRKIGAHLWTITFNPHNFFHYSPDSCLNSIACGFRDSAFVNYVKNGTNDIYILTYMGAATTSYPYITCSYTHSTNVSYSWNDGRTDSVRLFTAGGSYTVTATGVGGCTATGTVVINIGNTNVSIGDDTIECTTSYYTFVATPGFRTYQWLDEAASTYNIHTAANPVGGMYWVQATDSLGCVSRDTASVHLSATGYLSLPATLSSCPGIPVSADASTNIEFNGDSLVITYDATRGLTQLVGDTNVYFHSAPQFYSFAQWLANDPYTVGNYGQNDGVGRMKSLGNNKWQITIDPQSYYHFSPDTPMLGIWMIFRNFDGTKTGKDSNAANSNNIFLYTVPNPPTSPTNEVTGRHKARQPISYSWSNGVHTAADTFAMAGTYRVTVTDGVCTHTDSVVVSFSSSGVINIGTDTTVCSSSDTVIITAGAGYAHYLWSNSDTTQSIKVAGANTYSVTATSASGCISTGHRTISISSHAVSLGTDIVKCTNTPVVLSATPGFASYTWLNRLPSFDTIIVGKTGSYWVTATDSFGCTSHDTISVRYSEVLQTSLQDTFSSCPGNLVALDAGSNIQVHGDSITIFYDATQGQTGLIGANKVYMHSGPEFHPFQGWVAQYTVGNYGLDDGVGKMDSLGNNRWSITIFPQSYYRYSPDTPLNGIWMIFRNANGTQTGKDNTGNNIFLNLSGITPTCSFTGVTGIHKEAGTLTYAWSNTATAPSIAVSTTGHYSVTVSDGTCSYSDTTFVNLTSNLSVHIGNDTAICPSGSATFNAGAGFAHYHWNTGDSTQSITVSAASSYSVTVVSGSGCSASDTAVVRINGTKVNAGADVTRCNAGAVTLTASNGYRSYQWFGLGASSQTHSAVNDGCYWVLATDSTGCTSYDTVCVSTSGVQGLNSFDTVKVCIGDSTSFDASTHVNAKGDSLVITFDATQNANSSSLLGASKIYMHSAPQFYPFAPWGTSPYTVGNWGQDDGVGEMDSVGPNKWQITIYPSCYYHYNPDTPLNAIWMIFRNANGSQQSQGGNINLLLVGAGTPSTSYTGVSGAYKSTNNISYTWSTGAHTAATYFSTPGRYTVTATDGACSKTDTLTVIQNANPVVNLGHDTCLGATHTVGLTAGAGFSSYLWSTGASTQTITANLAGTYWVRVTNAAGCTGSDTVIVDSSCGTHVIPGCLPIPYFRVLNVSQANTVTIKDSSIRAVHYYWNFGDSSAIDTISGNQVHTYAASGHYTIMLITCDSCGCDTFSRVVNVNANGISEIDGLTDVNLYPNPASNSCTIRITASENADISIELTNILGATIQTSKAQISSGENKITMDLSTVLSGMYTLTIRSTNGILTRKLDIIK